MLKLLEARPDVLATLVTGRMRSLDKDAIVRERLSGLASSRSEARPPSETPDFVVSTQTLEVGADLDFDGLVSECASLDALRQRFGRLNRMGRPVEARAAIVMRADHAANSDDDPVDGHALAEPGIGWLARRDEHGEIDFGIAHLERVLPGAAALSALNAPAKEAPVDTARSYRPVVADRPRAEAFARSRALPASARMTGPRTSRCAGVPTSTLRTATHGAEITRSNP